MNEMLTFQNRGEAGKQLAEALEKYRGPDTVIYALPRGGVIVGALVADKLEAPLDILLVRKIGHPFNPEFAIGALSESGKLVGDVLMPDRVDPEWLAQEVRRLKQEISRRRELYKQGQPSISAKNKIAIIVDDGIATGSTMLAAIEEIISQNPKKIIVAAPVSPPDIADMIKFKIDEFVALLIPEPFFGAVGAYYEEFDQVSDEEVRNIMEKYH